MDDREDPDLPFVQLVNESIGSREKLANRSVTYLRNDLTAFCHLGERGCGSLQLLYESGRIGLGVPSDVFGRRLEILPGGIRPYYFSSHRDMRRNTSSCVIVRPCSAAARPR